MEIKKASEPTIGMDQSELESQKPKSESKPASSGISSARDSFESGRNLNQISDGTSNTIFAAELPSDSGASKTENNNFKDRPNLNIGSGFDGSRAVEELRDRSNPITVPNSPSASSKTRNYTPDSGIRRERSELEERKDDVKETFRKLHPIQIFSEGSGAPLIENKDVRDKLHIGKEFDGTEAAKELRDGTSNPILLPNEPMKTYTRKESK